MTDGKLVPVLIIIGPVGIGKSSTADAVSELLAERSIPHAVVDLDYVRRAEPAPDNDPFHMELGFRNLASVWSNYQDVGARCLLIPSVMEGEDDLERVRSAVPGAELFLVRLEVALEVNHERIRRREKTRESLSWHLNRSTQLDKELRERQLEDVVVEMGPRSPREVDEEIIAVWESTLLLNNHELS